MKITKIEEQKKRRNRFNIYLDDKFAFGLSEQALVDSGIYAGQELDQKEIDQIIYQEQRSKALDRAFLWLGIRPRSRFEIGQKLKEKDFSQKVIDETLARLDEMDYLDDQAFARAWVDDRKLNWPKGRHFIYGELIRKGVEREIIEKVLLENYSNDEEFDLALKLAKRKMLLLKNLEKKKIYQRLTNYLAQRGFNWEIIKAVWEEMESNKTKKQ